jgi:hypothetical protein
MDDRIRVSDADRERVTARLREHYAEGRLSTDELDDRVSAALGARTFGDLRRVMVDLPEPALAPPGGPVPPSGSAPRGWAPPGGAPPPWAGGYGWGFRRRRRLRIAPLLLIALIAVLVLPGAGFVLAAFFKVILVLWLVALVAGLIAASRFRRHARRYWQSGGGQDRGGPRRGGPRRGRDFWQD